MVITSKAMNLTHMIGVAIAVAILAPAFAPNAVAAAPDPVGYREVTSSELVERAPHLDGQRVTFAGEAIGSAMVRGDVAFLHLNDDPYASADPGQTLERAGYNSGQAVRVSPTLAGRVRTFGSHRSRGDFVRVSGVFHAADPRYGGDMLIEADNLTVVRRGHPLDEDVPTWKLTLLVALSVTTAAAFSLLRRRLTAHPA